MQSCLDSDDKGFCMFLVTIYLNMSSVNNFTPNEPPGETFTTEYFEFRNLTHVNLTSLNGIRLFYAEKVKVVATSTIFINRIFNKVATLFILKTKMPIDFFQNYENQSTFSNVFGKKLLCLFHFNLKLSLITEILIAVTLKRVDLKLSKLDLVNLATT